MAALSAVGGRPRWRTRWCRRGSPAGATRTSCRSTTRPTRARLLAEAGYPGGAGFPATILMTGGSGFDEAIVAELKRELGITLQAETMGDGYFDRLRRIRRRCGRWPGSPTIRAATTSSACCCSNGASNNYGHWSSPAFDAAIGEASPRPTRRRRAPPTTVRRPIVRDEVPVVPVVYGPGWALTRTGLLGAGQNGLGHRAHGGAGMGGLMRRARSAAGGRRSSGVGLLLGLVPAVAAAEPVTFGTPTADSTFGKGDRLQPAGHCHGPIGRVELLLTVADAIGPTVSRSGRADRRRRRP